MSSNAEERLVLEESSEDDLEIVAVNPAPGKPLMLAQPSSCQAQGPSTNYPELSQVAHQEVDLHLTSKGQQRSEA